MSEITRALAVTAELTGTELSAISLKAMEAELAQYPARAVFDALARCRRELTGRLTLAAVLERINAIDGRPTANEAWAVALRGFDEAQTIITNEEINEAMRAARPILDAGDEVGARMAFRDSYERIVAINRTNGVLPRWYPSLGSDKRLREMVVSEAVDRGMIDGAHYLPILPSRTSGDGAGVVAMLENKSLPADLSPKARQKLAEIKAMIARKRAA